MREILRLNHKTEGANDIRGICEEFVDIFKQPEDSLTVTKAKQEKEVSHNATKNLARKQHIKATQDSKAASNHGPPKRAQQFNKKGASKRKGKTKAKKKEERRREKTQLHIKTHNIT
jgi:hypothetical protein